MPNRYSSDSLGLTCINIETAIVLNKRIDSYEYFVFCPVLILWKERPVAGELCSPLRMAAKS